MSSSNRLLIGNLLLSILLLILPNSSLAQQTCNVAWTAACDAVTFGATSNILFYVNRTESNAEYETYNVTITYHWGESNHTVASTAYDIGETYGFSASYNYTNEDLYLVGYTLEFEDTAAANACAGATFERKIPLKMERTPDSCQLNAPTPNPTGSPTVTAGPTVSASPTEAPVVGAAVGGAVVWRFTLLGVGLVAVVGQSILYG